jgi:hypothetical protein
MFLTILSVTQSQRFSVVLFGFILSSHHLCRLFQLRSQLSQHLPNLSLGLSSLYVENTVCQFKLPGRWGRGVIKDTY